MRDSAPNSKQKRFPVGNLFSYVIASETKQSHGRKYEIAALVNSLAMTKLLYNATVPSEQTTSVAGTPLRHHPPFLIACHSAIVPLNVILVKLLQPLNAYSLIEVTLLGMVTLVTLLHL